MKYWGKQLLYLMGFSFHFQVHSNNYFLCQQQQKELKSDGNHEKIQHFCGQNPNYCYYPIAFPVLQTFVNQQEQRSQEKYLKLEELAEKNIVFKIQEARESRKGMSIDSKLRQKGEVKEEECCVVQNVVQKKKRKKKSKPIRSGEEEFIPYKRRTTKKIVQMDNRNTIPNILHHILTYIQKQSRSLSKVSKLLNEMDIQNNCSATRFYLYQQFVKERMNIYITPESLCAFKQPQDKKEEIYSLGEQTTYMRITQILILYFLRVEYNSFILTSKRVGEGKELSHLEKKRKLIEVFRSFFRN